MNFNWVSWIQRVLAPPVFDDEEHTQRAGLLNVSLLAALAFIVLLLVGTLLRRPFEADLAALLVVVLALLMALHRLMRVGRTRLASWGLILVSTFGVTGGLLIASTVASPMVASYLLIIVVAGLLLDYRAKIVIVVLNSIIVLGMYWAEQSGWVSSLGGPVLMRWLVSVALFALASAVIHVAQRQVNESIAYYRYELAERRRAEQERAYSDERLRSLLSAIPDLILTFSPQGVFTDIFTVSPLHEERRGLPVGTLAGRSIHEVFPPELAGRFQAVIDQAVDSGKVIDFEYSLNTPSGEPAWYQARISAFEAPEGRRVVWLARDITENKRADVELRELTGELEQRVHQRTAELVSVNRELEAFAYSVSHDLRAPLRGISGYGQMIDEDYRELLPEDGREMLTNLRKGAAQMNSLIEDLLRLARLANQPLSVQPVSMQTAAESAARLAVPDGQSEPPVSVVIADLPSTEADPVLVERVFANLLENAVKYSRNRPDPQIEVGWIRRDGSVVYYVRDNGVGFDMRYVDRIFGVFQRLHSAGEFEGSGIGLAITQRIIERHGGRIWAEGKVNEGATFYFTLPKLNL